MKDTFNGHTIALSHDHKFYVEGPLVDKQRYDSWDQATAAIAKAEKVAAELKKRNFKLPVQLHDGRLVHVKGINGTTGQCLFVEKVALDDNYPHTRSTVEIFPVSDAIGTLLARREQLKKELKELNHRLDPLSIKISRRYGRISTDAMIEELNKLEAEHKEKTEKAGKSI